MSMFPRTGLIPSCVSIGFNMAKGIVATLKEALLREGIAADIVHRMLHSKTGRLYFVLDSMEKLINEVAHRTKLLLNQGKAEDYQTLAEAVESLINPMKNVTIVEEPSEDLKEEIEESTWIPVRKLYTGEKRQKETFIIMRKRKPGDKTTGCIKIKACRKENPKENAVQEGTSCVNNVQVSSGLDILAEAAASYVKVPDLTNECPHLTKLLSDE